MFCNRSIINKRVQLCCEHGLHIVLAVRYDHAIAIRGIGAVRGRKDFLDGHELDRVLCIKKLLVVRSSHVQACANTLRELDHDGGGDSQDVA